MKMGKSELNCLTWETRRIWVCDNRECERGRCWRRCFGFQFQGEGACMEKSPLCSNGVSKKLRPKIPDWLCTQRIRTIEITEPVFVPRTVSFPVRGNINYTQLLVHLHLVLLNVQNITNDSRFSITDRSRWSFWKSMLPDIHHKMCKYHFHIYFNEEYVVGRGNGSIEMLTVW